MKDIRGIITGANNTGAFIAGAVDIVADVTDWRIRYWERSKRGKSSQKYDAHVSLSMGLRTDFVVVVVMVGLEGTTLGDINEGQVVAEGRTHVSLTLGLRAAFVMVDMIRLVVGSAEVEIKLN